MAAVCFVSCKPNGFCSRFLACFPRQTGCLTGLKLGCSFSILSGEEVPYKVEIVVAVIERHLFPADHIAKDDVSFGREELIILVRDTTLRFPRLQALGRTDRVGQLQRKGPGPETNHVRTERLVPPCAPLDSAQT